MTFSAETKIRDPRESWKFHCFQSRFGSSTSVRSYSRISISERPGNAFGNFSQLLFVSERKERRPGCTQVRAISTNRIDTLNAPSEKSWPFRFNDREWFHRMHRVFRPLKVDDASGDFSNLQRKKERCVCVCVIKKIKKIHTSTANRAYAEMITCSVNISQQSPTNSWIL